MTLEHTPTLRELRAGYERYLVGEQRRPRGRDRYLWAFDYIASWLAEQLQREPLLADLNAAAVRRLKEYCGGRGLATGTTINLLAVVRDFSTWCCQEGLRTDDPTLGVKRPKKRAPNPQPLYPHEVRAVLTAIGGPRHKGERTAARNRLAVILFLFTGLRISELAALRWGDIDLTARVLTVQDGKGGKVRTIPLHEQLAAELGRIPLRQRRSGRAVIGRPDGQAITSKGLAHIFERWLPRRLEAAGADMRVWAHRLRHTFASTLVWNDTDLRTVQELLGHAQLGTTEHYVKTDQRQKRRAIAKLDFTKPLDDTTDPEKGDQE